MSEVAARLNEGDVVVGKEEIQGRFLAFATPGRLALLARFWNVGLALPLQVPHSSRHDARWRRQRCQGPGGPVKHAPVSIVQKHPGPTLLFRSVSESEEPDIVYNNSHSATIRE